MATAVISEFNPFHNGHKYLLQTAKSLTDSPIIAVMSGSFTQRGEVAICDKFLRAKTAVQNGADLVVELPTVYAVSSAQRFARCGVEIAESFSCVDKIAFGCECDNSDLLMRAAKAEENQNVKESLAELMKEGDYFPRAYEKAVRKVLGDEVADILTSPNNILAVEYLRNINAGITPLAIKRIGAEHDSIKTSKNIASASHIRSLVRQGKDVGAFLPNVPDEITFPQNLERILLYKLRSMSKYDFAQLPEISEGLENRIFSAVQKSTGVDEIISFVKTKRYTHARIRRILICALLNITESDQKIKPEYVRVLAFNGKGTSLLKTTSFEIVTSPAAAIKSNSKNLKLLAKDIYASDIAALAYDVVKKSGNDYHAKITKFD